MINEGRDRAESNSSNGSGGIPGGKTGKRQKQGNNVHNGKFKMRPVTVETVRRIVAQEGRSARNLISWNAPLDMEKNREDAELKRVRRPNRRSTLKRRSKSCDAADKKDSARTTNSHAESKSTLENKTSSGASRSSSASKRQVSIRARYWAYLFENLRRAVDEIYATCETDQSVVECKEVLLVLDNYRHDFQALIDWINLQERLNSTDVANRPTSLAWEVRKSSPGRPRQRMTPRGGHQGAVSNPEAAHLSNPPNTNSGTQPSPHIKRISPDKKSSSSSTVTWADKVKGVPSTNAQQRSPRAQNRKVVNAASSGKKNNKENSVPTTTNEKKTSDDEDGWEKVSSKNKQPKSNKVHSTKPAMSKKQSNDINGTDVGTKEITVTKDNNSNLVIINGGQKVDGNGKMTETLNFFVDSITRESPATPMPAKDSTPDYSGIVVERSMGTSSTSSYGEKSPGNKEETTSLNKVLFDDDDASKDIDFSLQTLDEVEADFFNSDPTLVSIDDDEDSSVLRSIDESDSDANKALLEHEASIAAAEHEEQQLMKEIEAEENKPIDVEGAAELDTPSAASNGMTPQESTDWSTIMARFEADEELNRGMTWGDMIEEEEVREPGRIAQMHEKLSSPSRRRTPAESKRKMEEKQRSATIRRKKMVQDKTERIHILTEKVDDVRKLKFDLIMGKTALIKELHIDKLQRAEQQRAMKLNKIVQKAQAEETKVNVILFINELQEQNKRHDVLNRILEHDARLQEMQQERSKMHEVKAAKEENVKERRRLLEKEREERLSELIIRRKEQDSRIEQLKQEREKEREKCAREKERDRKTRLSALNAAQQEAVTELQKKIQIKHDESERRHQEQLEQRKEKAVELSLGRFSLSSSGNMQSGELQNTIYEGDRVVQKSGNVSTSIDLSSIPTDERETGKGDASVTSKNQPQDGALVTSPRNNSSAEEKRLAKEREVRVIERKKAMKKRAKKLKTRMSSRGRDFSKSFDQKSSTSSSSKNKVYRLVKDVIRQLNSQKETSGPWPANRISALDRALGEINRLLEKQDESSKTLFRTSGGFEMLEQVFEVPLNSNTFQGQKGETVSIVPDKTIANAALTYKSACQDSYDNVLYVLYSSRLTILVDALTHQLTKHLPEEGFMSNAKSPTSARKVGNNKNVTPDDLFDPAASSLLDTLAFCIGFLASKPPVTGNGKLRLNDNKQLLRALKMTLMTSSRPGSAGGDDLDAKKLTEGFLNRGLDVVSYIVSCGVLDKLSVYLGCVRSEIDAHSKAAAFIKNGLSFQYSITDFVALRNRNNSESTEGRVRRTSTSSNASSVDKKQPEVPTQTIPATTFDSQMWDTTDPTQLLPTLYHTEVMGVVSVLYGILLHGAPERPIVLRNNSILDDVTGSSPPLKQIPLHVLQIAMSVMLVLNAVADLDIHLLQESLGAEGVSLEFRHICAYLLWYCQHGAKDGLLHEVIVCVGHFALCNKKNQDTVHSGAMPTVLQQLCALPFAYFSNPRLSDILFPTLIACCHDNPTNLAMLEQEASSSLLSSYIKGVLEESGSEDDAVKSSEGYTDTNLKTESAALSSSRLYTVSFLRGALRFFDEMGAADHTPILSSDVTVKAS